MLTVEEYIKSPEKIAKLIEELNYYKERYEQIKSNKRVLRPPKNAPKYYKDISDIKQGLEAYHIVKTKNPINHSNMLINLLNSKDLQKDVQNPKRVIKAIENADHYEPASKKALFQIIVWAADHIGFHMTPEAKKLYDDAFQKSKIAYAIFEAEKRANEEVPRIKDYMNKLSKTFGADSKQYMIGSLYCVVPCRDDFQLEIVPTLPKDDSKNYIVVPKTTTKPLTVILNNYKTSDTYGQGKTEIPAKVSNQLRKYMKDNNLTYGDYLFGKDKLSAFIGNMNKEMGLKENKKIAGNVNLFRKMIVSNILNGVNNLDATIRFELSGKMYHSPATSQKYIRQFMQEQL